MKSYSEKLKDPRWQKRRLQMLEKDGWKCSVCNDSDKTLHVHHLEYNYGCEPWEYDDSSLLTVCETCHDLIHADDDGVIHLISTCLSLRAEIEHIKDVERKMKYCDITAIMVTNDMKEISYHIDDHFVGDVERKYSPEMGVISFTLIKE